MEQRFKVGDKVIALDTNAGEGKQPRTAGHSYTVADMKFCAKCGIQTISLAGSPVSFTGVSRCSCDNRTPTTKMWTFSKLFVLDDPTEIVRAIEEAVEEEDYELASILRDVLAEKETA